MKIQLTSVFVDDPVKAFKFYTEKLGFIERMFVPDAQLAIVASPEDPNGTGLLLEPNGNLGAKAFQKGVYEAGLPYIVFGVKDINAEVARLKERGVRITQEPTKADWGTHAVFDDDNGNLIQIVEGA